MRCGTGHSAVSRTSWRSMWATFGARSTARSTVRRSIPSGVSATGSTGPAADVNRHMIRMRITAAALGLAGTGLVAAAVLMLVLLQLTMRDNVDSQARLRLVEIADLVRSDRLPDSLAGEDDSTVGQVVVHDVVVAQSPT